MLLHPGGCSSPGSPLRGWDPKHGPAGDRGHSLGCRRPTSASSTGSRAFLCWECRGLPAPARTSCSAREETLWGRSAHEQPPKFIFFPPLPVRARAQKTLNAHGGSAATANPLGTVWSSWSESLRREGGAGVCCLQINGGKESFPPLTASRRCARQSKARGDFLQRGTGYFGGFKASSSLRVDTSHPRRFRGAKLYLTKPRLTGRLTLEGPLA